PKKVSRPLFSTSKSIQCLSHLPPQLGFQIPNSVERSLKTSGISSTTDQPLAANLRPSRLKKLETISLLIRGIAGATANATLKLDSVSNANFKTVVSVSESFILQQ